MNCRYANCTNKEHCNGERASHLIFHITLGKYSHQLPKEKQQDARLEHKTSGRFLIR